MLRQLIPSTLLLLCSLLPAQTVLRVGALTAIPGILDPIKGPVEKELNIRLVYKEENASDMLPDVQAGNLDLALAGVTLAAWVEGAKAKGHPVKPLSEYQSVRMGLDSVNLLVNPDVVTVADLLILELTKDQIKGLFTGRIRNWKEIGGPDLPVVVMVSHWFVSTLKVFRDKVLDGEPLVAGYQTIQGSIYDIPRALVATKGAITFGPIGLTTNTKIWSPSMATKIERPFTLLISDKLDPDKKQAVARLLAFIQGPGQGLITK